MLSKINTRKTLAVLLSLLFASAVLFAVFSAPVSADKGKADSEKKDKKTVFQENLEKTGSDKEEEGVGVHKDPATFEKNFCLSAGQKEFAITKIEDVVSKITSPEMSDLEKYYRLAVWENMHVTYDSDFWSGRYYMELYRHQWDAYGVLTDKSVCAGMAITYANFCHAADLPCKFVRTDPKILDHTINYVPDINGNAYYLDVTENDFLMTGGFADIIDKRFANITKDPTDSTFEYRSASESDDEGFSAINIKECYLEKCEDWSEGSFTITYDDWYKDLSSPETSEKVFGAPYEEKGSGVPKSDSKYKHRSYQDFENYPAQTYELHPDREVTGIWFLDDFYEEPGEVLSKIENNELDEQLLDISGVKKNYDCDTSDELIAAINNDISVRYFPSVENDKVVAKAAALTKDTDYSINCESFDLQNHKAEVTIKGEGDYSGSYSITVKLRSAVVSKAPVSEVGLVYNGSPQALVKPGKAENGTMVYAVCMKGDPEPDDQQYTESIPKKTDAGSYDVWYKVIGDEEHADAEPQKLERPVVIAPMEVNVYLSDAITLKVGGSYQLDPILDIHVPAKFTYESEDENIATVSKDGVIKGVSEGETIITIHAKQEDPDPNYADADDMDIWIKVVPKDSSEDAAERSEDAAERMDAVHDKLAQVLQMLADALIKQNADEITKLKQQIADLNNQLSKTSRKTNTLAVKGRKATVKYKSLKKKAKSLKVTKVIKFKKKGQGTKIYAKAAGNRKITINKKTGKVTMKKGMKRGTYKVKIRVKAKGNTKYKPSPWKTVTFKVRVK